MLLCCEGVLCWMGYSLDILIFQSPFISPSLLPSLAAMQTAQPKPCNQGTANKGDVAGGESTDVSKQRALAAAASRRARMINGFSTERHGKKKKPLRQTDEPMRSVALLGCIQTDRRGRMGTVLRVQEELCAGEGCENNPTKSERNMIFT